jgi:tripartite-type tricarboxylate transporter receptor subunit TctC
MANRRETLKALAAAPLLAGPWLGARAQAFPVRPVRILVGFTPGGLPDITARLIGQKLSEAWKQPVTVENRPGAGGNLAAQAVASAPADGYTLLSISSAHTSTPAIYPKLAFDVAKDFAGITMTATGPCLLVVAPDLPVKTVADLIALARAKPGALNFSSAGIGSGTHFAVEVLKAQTGIDVVHVPFKGIPEALAETVAGRVHFFMAPFATAIALVKDGRARAIGITSTKRVAETPNLPTLAESGAPGYRYAIWSGLLAPAKTPRPLVEQLNAEVVRILRLPETAQRLAPLGTEAAPGTPEEFDRLITEEVASFTRLARAGNIKVE